MKLNDDDACKYRISRVCMFECKHIHLCIMKVNLCVYACIPVYVLQVYLYICQLFVFFYHMDRALIRPLPQEIRVVYS